MGKALVRIREGVGKVCVRNRQGLRKIVVIWVCGRFFGPVMQPAPSSCGIASGAAVPKLLRCRVGLGRPQAPAVRHRARSAQLPLRPPLILMPEVGVENAAEFGNRHARSVAMVIEPDSCYQCSQAWRRSRPSPRSMTGVLLVGHGNGLSCRVRDAKNRRFWSLAVKTDGFSRYRK